MDAADLDLPTGPWRPKNKSQLKKWEKLMQNAQTLKATTFDAAEMVPPPEYIPQRGLVRRTQIAGFDSDEFSERPTPLPPAKEANKMLDGFLLLESCQVEFPDEARRADVNGRLIADVAQEDLQYFSNLAYLDIGDNRAPFEPMGTFPVLRELHFQCNLVRQISGIEGFSMLEVLDLSYNALTNDSILELTKMPKLRELDLTCNALTELPDMTGFQSLEILVIERNRFGNQCFTALSVMPKLKVLNIGFNYISALPESEDGGDEDIGFKLLEELNLSNNYIAREQDIMRLVEIPRLHLVILYGNPLTEQTTSKRLLSSGGSDGQRPVIKTVTEVPDNRKRRGGAGTYTNFSVATVSDSNIPTAANFRAAGNQILFSAGDDPTMSDGAMEGVRPRYTEATREKADERAGRSDPQNADTVGRNNGPTEPDGTFLTGVGVGVDDGMGGDMGMMQQDEDEDDFESDDDYDDYDDGLEVPPIVLQRSLAAGSEPANPAKLRSAINALRYALQHPLTSHTTYPKKGQRMVDRPTFLQICRQRQRRPYVPKSETSAGTSGAGGGRAAPLEETETKQEQQETLGNIEEVLDQMNTRMAVAEQDADSAMNSDQNMASLIKMVSKVMDTYEGF